MSDRFGKKPSTRWSSLLLNDKALDGDRFVSEAAREACERLAAGKLNVIPAPQAVHPAPDFEVSRAAKIFYVFCGANQVHSPVGNYEIPAGSIGFIPARYPHRETQLRSDGCYAHLFLGIHPQTIYYNIPTTRPHEKHLTRGAGDRNTPLHGLPYALMAEITGRTNGLSKTLLIALLELVAEYFAEPPHQLESPLVLQCRVLIHTRLNDPDLSAASLARELRVHPDHLSRKFHAETGVRLRQHIQIRRMELARDLLMHTPSNVGEVAGLCGFTDSAYFSRSYRVAYGCSPSDVRALRGS